MGGDADNWGNGYAYGGANPVNGFDVMGLSWFQGLKNFVGGAIDGAVSGVTFGLVETTICADLLGADTSSASYMAGNVTGNVLGGVASAAATGGVGTQSARWRGWPAPPCESPRQPAM